MIRTLALIVSIAVSGIPASTGATDRDEAARVAAMWADAHCAQSNCPSLGVNLPILVPYADKQIGRDSELIAPTLVIYQERASTLSLLASRAGADAVCTELFEEHGTISIGWNAMLLQRPARTIEGFETFSDHHAFNFADLASEDQSRARNALADIYFQCDGLIEYQQHIRGDGFEFFEPSEPIVYPGSSGPWERILRFRFIVDETDQVPAIWYGHAFEVSLNNDRTELIASKDAGHHACGMTSPSVDSGVAHRILQLR